MYIGIYWVNYTSSLIHIISICNCVSVFVFYKFKKPNATKTPYNSYQTRALSASLLPYMYIKCRFSSKPTWFYLWDSHPGKIKYKSWSLCDFQMLIGIRIINKLKIMYFFALITFSCVTK